MNKKNGVLQLTIEKMIMYESVLSAFSRRIGKVPFEVIYKNGKKHKDSDKWVNVVRNYNEQRAIFEHLFKTAI